MTVLEILGLVGGGVTVIFAALSGFFAWRNGAPQISSDVISTYKARLEQLEEERKGDQAEIKVMSAEINQLKGEGKGKDDRIASLEAILQGRNPEMIEFMRNTSMALKSIQEFFEMLRANNFSIVPTPK